MLSIWRKRKNISTKGRVFVGLSGGVDSAVSATLLTREGYRVTGVFIRIQIPGYPCPAVQDRIEAMRVAAHLDIPFIEIDLSEEYRRRVFEISMQEFARDRTPNPDAFCNREIKFGAFFDFAKSRGADFVATGHYAQIRNAELFEGVDPTKDQSYFLWAVPKEQLKETLFPVGGMHKTKVRALAKKFKLPNAKRRDSQGLCFLGDISLEDMLIQEVSPVPGNVIDEKGEILGTHKGTELYTLGQRHGFVLLAGTPEEKPYFVIAKDSSNNTLTVSINRFPQHAKETRLTLLETNWIGEIVEGEYMARFRYHQKLIRATLRITSKNTAEVILHEPQYVPLGQSLVVYKGERCWGGGIIDTASIE